MSVAIAVRDDRATYVGADSALVDLESGDLMTISSPKLKRVGSVAIAWAGSVAQAHRVSCHLEGAGVDTIESVRCAMACFDRSGADVAYFVVACRDGIAVIDDDGSVSEPYHEYCAVGLGGPIALGALGAMAHVPPIERIHSAISLCETHNSTVRGPWDVLQVEMD